MDATQGTLDDYLTMVRTNDQSTSRAAAAQALRSADTDRARVYDVLRQHPAGLTDFEIADLLGRQQTSLGKRRLDLQRLGLVVKATDDAGREIKRPAPSGSLALVWRAID
jgi:hypothetical protein